VVAVAQHLLEQQPGPGQPGRAGRPGPGQRLDQLEARRRPLRGACREPQAVARLPLLSNCKPSLLNRWTLPVGFPGSALQNRWPSSHSPPAEFGLEFLAALSAQAQSENMLILLSVDRRSRQFLAPDLLGTGVA
jgi:hypothetical protein